MTGTIFLGGCGEAQAERRLWQAMVRAGGRIVYWPFAVPAPERPRVADELRRSLHELDLDAVVDAWMDLDDRRPGDLAAADLLLVSGGNTFHLLDHVRRHGFLDPVREFVAGGGDYYGGSAGALLACADIRAAVGYDDNDLELTDPSALGLVSGFTVWPHYDDAERANAERASVEWRTPVLGVPDRAGLIVRGAEVEAVGPDPVHEFTSSQILLHHPGDRWIVE